MTDINHLLNKILSAPKDNTLYLIEKFPCDTGLFASNGNVLYMVHNEEHCSAMSVKTDFLSLETNIYVSAFNASVLSFKNGSLKIGNSTQYCLIKSMMQQPRKIIKQVTKK